jgi:predicted HTH domain antitoxin
VVDLNRDHPDAMLIGLEQGGVLQAPGVRAALATALFRDGELSLARAARVAELDVASFISHLGRLGIPAIRLSAAETNADLDTLEP